MTQAIITKEEYLNLMTNNQLVSRISDIMSEILEITEYEQRAIKGKDFRNINIHQDQTRILVKEAEELERVIAKRDNLKQEVSQAKRDKFKKLQNKLAEILEQNRIDVTKIISINKLAITAISSAIAHKKKFEYGYDHVGKLPESVVIRKNTLPLNLNEKC